MFPFFRPWARLRPRRSSSGFHSAFGGLWTDRLDAAERLRAKRARGELGDADALLLAHWMDEGYAVVPGALAPERVDVLRREIDALWETDGERVLVELGGRVRPYRRELRAEHCKLIDVYGLADAALELALAPAVQRFLGLLFEQPPLLFQSLSFERGSEQPAHQDTAYVVVSRPMELVAAWIALEDVQPGAGELFYHPRSHRLAPFLFGDGALDWNRARDGVELQRRYHAWVEAKVEAHALSRATFLPRKGDVLFWSADLVHGGTPIVDRTRSRKSLVCHYCPADARPSFLSHVLGRRIARHPSGARWVSAHYAQRRLRRTA